MPRGAREWVGLFLHASKAVDATQIASARPQPTSALQRPKANGGAGPGARLTPSAQRSSTASSGRLVRFQRASGPTPIRNSAGAISGTNTASKYGGPTEILPTPSASSSSGESVPSTHGAGAPGTPRAVAS